MVIDTLYCMLGTATCSVGTAGTRNIVCWVLPGINKDQKLVDHFLENRTLLIAVPLKMYSKFGQPKWISRPNAEIGQKMANGHLLFLALFALWVLLLHHSVLGTTTLYCMLGTATCSVGIAGTSLCAEYGHLLC